MRLYTPDEMPRIQALAKWKSSAWRGLTLVSLIMVGITCFTAMPKFGQVDWPFVATAAVVSGFFVLLTLHRFWHESRKENWLVQVVEQGVYFNLRVASNRHLPHSHPSIVFVEAHEIAGIGLTHEYLGFPGQRGKKLDQCQYIDFYLQGSDLRALREAVRKERRIGLERGTFTRRKIDQYPIQVLDDPAGIRVNWDWIHPKIQQSLDTLATWYAVSDEVRERRVVWAKLDDAEKLAFIKERWETGHVKDAAKILNMTQKMSPLQCKAWFQEELIDSED